MSEHLVDLATEFSKKCDPERVEREYPGMLRFKGYQFINPKKEGLKDVIKRYKRHSMLLKLSLRKDNIYDHISLIMIKGNIYSMIYSADNTKTFGVEAVKILEDKFKDYESCIIEEYVIEDELISKILDEYKGLSEEIKEKIVESKAEEEVTVLTIEGAIKELDSIKNTLKELVQVTCKTYGYNLKGFSYRVEGDSIMFEIKVSPIFARVKIPRVELQAKLSDTLKPHMPKGYSEKFKVKLK